VARKRLLVIALCMSCSAHGLAQSGGQGEARGKMLYDAHCSGCHTAEVHWRDKKLANDWSSLKAQVRRWQSNIGVDWSEEDVNDVARYLNANFYRLPAPEKS
jgi:mono/diheme cytochrome c family protein